MHGAAAVAMNVASQRAYLDSHSGRQQAQTTEKKGGKLPLCVRSCALARLAPDGLGSHRRTAAGAAFWTCCGLVAPPERLYPDLASSIVHTLSMLWHLIFPVGCGAARWVVPACTVGHSK